MKQFYIISLLFFILQIFSQNSSDIDSQFNNFNLPINNKFIDQEVKKNYISPNGEVYILTNKELFKLNNNLIDTSLNVSGFSLNDPNSSFILSDFLVQQDGKIIIIGSFNKYRNITRNSILRLNPDGSLDSTFNTNFSTFLSDSKIQIFNDGKILIYFDLGSKLIKLNPNGSIDTTFQLPTPYNYKNFQILNDQNIMVVRNGSSNNSVQLSKLNSDGLIDNNFNISNYNYLSGTSESNIYCILETTDNKLLIGGKFTSCNNISKECITKLNSNGTIDTNFNIGNGIRSTFNIFSGVLDIKELANGNYIIVGDFNKFNNNDRLNIVVINSDGSLNVNFNNDLTFLNLDSISNVSIKNNQKILVTGRSTSGFKSDDYISFLNIDGTKDLTFQNITKGFYGTYGNVTNVLSSNNNNNLFVSGHFKSYNDQKCIGFAKINLDGTLDNNLNNGFDSQSLNNGIEAIYEETDGSIILGGNFSKYNNLNIGNIIKINPNGSLNTNFQILTSGFKNGNEIATVKTITKAPNGNFIITGDFNLYNNTPNNGCVILNSTGSYIGIIDYGLINFLKFQSDGKLLVAGNTLKRYNGLSLNIDSTFNLDTSITNSSIKSFELLPDGKIYIQGYFSINGVSKTLCRLNSNGTIDNTFDTTLQNSNFEITSISLLQNNKIIVCTNNNSTFAKKIIRLNYNGSIDTTFNEIILESQTFIKTFTHNNGSIYIFGNYKTTNGISRGLFKILGTEYKYLTSKIKFDINNNLCDINDIKLNNIKFDINSTNNSSNNHSISSNYLGEINLGFENGSHTITPVLENPTFFTVSPSNFVVNFPTQTSPQNQDFCVTANGIKHDVEVSITPTTPARPGFDTHYKIIYKNKGNQSENGTINLQFDDAVLDFVSSNTTLASQTLNNLNWNYSNLQPFETREISVVLYVNSPSETPAVNSGDILNYVATITQNGVDEMSSDNTFTLNQTVVNSYDPNDKTCLQGNFVGPDKIGEYVHYMIRFENTGTYPAQNIVVKDMIDTNKFDVSTLIPLHASHNYYTKITDNKVEFIFENINLPFDNANNDGYIVFKIKTKPTLIVGDTFSNTANIYFDYNFPIVTNTATTTIAALINESFAFENYFNIYPNPTSGELNIKMVKDIKVNSIEIYNTIGQIVQVQTGNQLQLNVSDLKTGNYFIKINTSEGYTTSQFIKK